MEKKLFLISFSFLSLKIWQLLYVILSHFEFRFFMKGTLLWCLMGVRADKKIIQTLVCFVIDIYEFFWHMVHEKM
jgi:hypothetical protein